jgi:hypothetical protein
MHGNDPPEDILALAGLVHQLAGLVPEPLPEYKLIPELGVPVCAYSLSFLFIC